MISQHIPATAVVPTELSPEGFLLDRRQYTFATDSSQIRNAEQITVVVSNANSPDEARRLVREFLQDVREYGLRIV